MNRRAYTSILGAALYLGGLGCGGGSDDGGGSSSAGTSPNGSVASCDDECRDYYDCQFSLCLLQGGTACSTQHVDGLATCDRLTESDCTPSLVSTYDSCGGSDDASSGGGSSSRGESSSEGGSSGWGESSSEGGSSGCLPPNSFCDFDSECCSGVCDPDFAFCH